MPNLTRVNPRDDQTLEMTFDSGEVLTVPYFDLRLECPCATCVDEITGKRTLKAESLPRDVRPRSVSPVGRYALQMIWSDGHSTGMYHFDRLYGLGKRSVEKPSRESSSDQR
jgi:DUF971 family protein